MYDKLSDAVIGNCDTLIFLGGNENETCEYISKKLGKTTIRTVSGNHNLGRNGGYSVGQNQAARDLMDPAEVAKMDNTMSIVIVRGLDPFFVPKYSLFDHPNFAMCGDNRDADNMVGDEFMDKFYTCTSKDIAEEDEIMEGNEEDKDIMEYGETPGLSGGPATSEQKPVNDLASMADAMGLDGRTATEEEVVNKMTPTGDLKEDGTIFIRDVTDEPEDTIPDAAALGTDGDPFDSIGDIPDADDPFADAPSDDPFDTAPMDATDHGMESFDDSPESMDMESAKWLLA